MREVQLVTPAGLHVGRTGMYKPDAERLNRSVEKIARGLHFHHTGRPIPADMPPTARLHVRADPVPETLRDALTALPNARSIADGSFHYRWYISETNGASAWGMVFYRSILGVAVFGTEKAIRAAI
jgi:hypothetical protein